MKFRYFIVGLIFLALALDAVDGARSRNRSRNRSRGRRRRANCHMKAIDRCMNKVEKLSNDPNSSIHMTSNEGLDKICGATKSVIRCMKGYMKKCGTPLQREMFDFLNEEFNGNVDKFCKNQTVRDEFLKESPCMHEKVIQTDGYKKQCVNPFLAGLDKTKQLDDMDSRLDLTCCTFNRWEDCVYTKIGAGCGDKAEIQIKEFLRGAFGGQAKLLCTDEAFDFKGDNCKKLFPPPDTKAKGKYSDNPLTRYISIYFGFLF